MPGRVIGKQFDLGYPGAVSRSSDAIIRGADVAAASSNISFGDPIVLSSTGEVSKFAGSNVAADFAGIAVREVKQATVYDNSPVQYLPNQPIDFLVRGSIMVICRAGTPAARGKVYIRVAAGTESQPIGGFEAAADSTNTIEVPNLVWNTGKMDTDKVTEVTILQRNA